jgi:hypothetical protein
MEKNPEDRRARLVEEVCQKKVVVYTYEQQTKDRSWGKFGSTEGKRRQS